MATDSLGHELPPVLPRLRNSQWVGVKLKDADRQAELVKLGAFQSPSGYLPCIYRTAHKPPIVETVQGRTVTKDGEQTIPDLLHPVTAQGHNVAFPVPNPMTGHMAIEHLAIAPENPDIAELQLLNGVQDLPPGRVMSSRWLQGFHGKGELPDDVHAKYVGEMTPTEFLSEFGKLPKAEVPA